MIGHNFIVHSSMEDPEEYMLLCKSFITVFFKERDWVLLSSGSFFIFPSVLFSIFSKTISSPFISRRALISRMKRCHMAFYDWLNFEATAFHIPHASVGWIRLIKLRLRHVFGGTRGLNAPWVLTQR